MLRCFRRMALSLPLLVSACENEGSEPNPTFPVGVVIHTASDPHVAKMKEMGATWVRIDASWPMIEPTAPTNGDTHQYNFAVLDKAVARSSGLGLKIFASLSGTPVWAARTPAPWFGGSSNAVPEISPWIDFVRAVVLRYPSIRHWGIWNEPNIGKFWAGTPREYFDVLLLPAYSVIKAIDPRLKVLGPEVGLYASKSRKEMKKYLALIKARGYDRYVDIVTLHTYHTGVDGFEERLDDLAAMLHRSGLREKPVWLTEFGWDSLEVSETQQAVRLGQALRILARRPWIERAFLYEMRDDPDSHTAFGLLNAIGEAKEAYDEVRRTIRSGFTYPAPPGDEPSRPTKSSNPETPNRIGR